MEQVVVLFVDFGHSHHAVALSAQQQPAIRSIVDETVGADASVRRTSHLALRLALSAIIGPERAARPFTVGAYGRPELALDRGSAQPNVSFSLAHSGETAVIALSRSVPVGIDLEVIRPRRISDARRRMIEAAATAMSGPLATEPDVRFIEAWVRIEAAAKATGLGVARLLHALGARQPGGTDRLPEIVDRFLAEQQIRVDGLAAPEAYRAALACSAHSNSNVLVWLPDSVDGIEDVLNRLATL